MSVVWKLQGGTVSTATAIGDLGVSNVVRSRRSLALDELTFIAAGAAVDSTALFAYGDTVTLTRTVDAGSPVKWFVGICVQVPRLGAAVRGEDTRYVIAGTWWYFENLVFQQIWPLDPTANSHLTSPATYRRAIVVSGLASSTGLRQNTKAFLQDVLDWLIASGTGAVTQYTAGDLPAGFEVPFMRLDSPTCAEAVQAICRWMPDAASWFDYTTNPPSFHLVRRSAAGGSNLALTALAEVDLTPRYELRLDKLIIQFVTLDANGMAVLHEDRDPAGSGTTGREWGAAVVTIDNNYLPIPTGLAAAYRAGLSTLHYSGRVVLEEDECTGSLSPGQIVNITGGLTAWATMAAHVVETIEEIDAGRTTINLGPPNHIRIDDLIEVLKIARNQSDQFGGSGEILKAGDQDRSQVLSSAVSVAGRFPDTGELTDAIEAAYSGKPAPRVGDIVHLTVGGVIKFRATMFKRYTPGSGFVVLLPEIGGTLYCAHVVQTGIY